MTDGLATLIDEGTSWRSAALVATAQLLQDFSRQAANAVQSQNAIDITHAVRLISLHSEPGLRVASHALSYAPLPDVDSAHLSLSP